MLAILPFATLLAIFSFAASVAHLTMSEQEAIQIKFKLAWNPLVEMEIGFVSVGCSWDPSNSLCNLEDLHVCA